jgi:hypothetical protein
MKITEVSKAGQRMAAHAFRNKQTNKNVSIGRSPSPKMTETMFRVHRQQPKCLVTLSHPSRRNGSYTHNARNSCSDMDSEDQHFGAIVLSSEEAATNIHYSQIS